LFWQEIAFISESSWKPLPLQGREGKETSLFWGVARGSHCRFFLSV
jgi:hypothetical protein